LPLDLIATKETLASERIGQTDRIVFSSLRINFMRSARSPRGTYTFHPVIRDGSIAPITGEKAPTEQQSGGSGVRTEQEVMLVHVTSTFGASGSPVFLRRGPRVRGSTFAVGTQPVLLGVMHGLHAENSGVAIVFPAWRLREILDLEMLKVRIAQLWAEK
jgi:hypothetical protein